MPRSGSNDRVLFTRINDAQYALIRRVADARFEGNGAAAARWLLDQAPYAPDVADELAKIKAKEQLAQVG